MAVYEKDMLLMRKDSEGNLHLLYPITRLANVDGADEAAGVFCTELTRSAGVVHVVCHGLTAGETYAVHLYTAARRRGIRHDPWRHPSNENTGTGYTGKGYANLAGKYFKDADSGIIYPAVPDWMPNNGILQTEWEFTATGETEKLDIVLTEWLLPMLKPVEGDFSNGCTLIGIAKGVSAPILMQFCLVKNGIVGVCKNTLRVGLRACGGAVPAIMAADVGIRTLDLYTSIK